MTHAGTDVAVKAAALRVALSAAQAGSEVLIRHWTNRPEMRAKADGAKSFDLVSDADLESEAAIVERVREDFPHHQILGEEGVAGPAPSAPPAGAIGTEPTQTRGKSTPPGYAEPKHLWVIDPLDGTNNFAHGIPQFAVSIAYFRDGRPIVGVIANPARGEVYHCVAGGGAFSNGQPARCSEVERLNAAMIGCGFYYDRDEMMRSTLGILERLFVCEVHGIRRFGAAALDLVAVGMGQLDGFFELELSPWDFAAGMLFVQEAGGKITTAQGKSMPVAVSSVVASNGRLHDRLLEQVGRLDVAD